MLHLKAVIQNFLMMVIAAFCWLFCSHYSCKSWQLTSKKLNSCQSTLSIIHRLSKLHMGNSDLQITLNFAVLAAVLINKAFKYQIRKSDLTTSGVNIICIEEGIEDLRKSWKRKRKRKKEKREWENPNSSFCVFMAAGQCPWPVHISKSCQPPSHLSHLLW